MECRNRCQGGGGVSDATSSRSLLDDTKYLYCGFAGSNISRLVSSVFDLGFLSEKCTHILVGSLIRPFPFALNQGGAFSAFAIAVRI